MRMEKVSWLHKCVEQGGPGGLTAERPRCPAGGCPGWLTAERPRCPAGGGRGFFLDLNLS